MIGTREFVLRCYRMFASHFSARHEKQPRRISGLDGISSLKRLSVAG